MSEKSIELSWKRECQTNKNPKVIKQKSKSLLLVDNWEQIKLSVMKQVIECKFRFPSDNKHVLLLNKLLIQTGEEDIYEYNYWGDTFWGIDSKTLKGENHLGKILMKRRQELKILMNEFYTRNKEIFNNK